jgi:hypothetical protein
MNRSASRESIPFPSACRAAGCVLACLLGAAAFAAARTEPEEGLQPVSRFGRQYLQSVELAAEVLVEQVSRMGLGVDVVTVKLEKVLFEKLPKELAGKKRHLMLANRETFQEGTHLLLLMKRFHQGDRLIVLHRLSPVEDLYEEKVKLMEEYIAVERLPDPGERVRRLAALVLRNLKSTGVWTQWNSLHELNDLIDGGAYPFTQGDVAYVRRAGEQGKDETLKKRIGEAADRMAKKAVEGPPSIEDPKSEPKKTGEGTAAR